MGGALVRLYILLALLGGVAMDGTAARYSPGLMERVAERRGMAVQGCLISSAYYGVGTRLWVWGKQTSVLRLCTVVDVSHPRDVKRHRRTGRIIELSHTAARELCGSTSDPPSRCPVLVIKLED